ncbi:unnamed protein product [Amoebophrya sp. A120]|nr:unnamed protein product [Amoebophrya sp. A120]|eukprot:GSA120T00008841001.1
MFSGGTSTTTTRKNEAEDEVTSELTWTARVRELEKICCEAAATLFREKLNKASSTGIVVASSGIMTTFATENNYPGAGTTPTAASPPPGLSSAVKNNLFSSSLSNSSMLLDNSSHHVHDKSGNFGPNVVDISNETSSFLSGHDNQFAEREFLHALWRQVEAKITQNARRCRAKLRKTVFKKSKWVKARNLVKAAMALKNLGGGAGVPAAMDCKGVEDMTATSTPGGTGSCTISRCAGKEGAAVTDEAEKKDHDGETTDRLGNHDGTAARPAASAEQEQDQTAEVVEDICKKQDGRASPSEDAPGSVKNNRKRNTLMEPDDEVEDDAQENLHLSGASSGTSQHADHADADEEKKTTSKNTEEKKPKNQKAGGAAGAAFETEKVHVDNTASCATAKPPKANDITSSHLGGQEQASPDGESTLVSFNNTCIKTSTTSEGQGQGTTDSVAAAPKEDLPAASASSQVNKVPICSTTTKTDQNEDEILDSPPLDEPMEQESVQEEVVNMKKFLDQVTKVCEDANQQGSAEDAQHREEHQQEPADDGDADNDTDNDNDTVVTGGAAACNPQQMQTSQKVVKQGAVEVDDDIDSYTEPFLTARTSAFVTSNELEIDQMEVEQFISTTQQQSGDNDKNLAKSKSDNNSLNNNYNDYMTSPGDTWRSFEDAKSVADFSKEKLESCFSQADENDTNADHPGGAGASQASTGQVEILGGGDQEHAREAEGATERGKISHADANYSADAERMSAKTAQTEHPASMNHEPLAVDDFHRSCTDQHHAVIVDEPSGVTSDHVDSEAVRLESAARCSPEDEKKKAVSCQQSANFTSSSVDLEKKSNIGGISSGSASEEDETDDGTSSNFPPYSARRVAHPVSLVLAEGITGPRRTTADHADSRAGATNTISAAADKDERSTARVSHEQDDAPMTEEKHFIANKTGRQWVVSPGLLRGPASPAGGKGDQQDDVLEKDSDEIKKLQSSTSSPPTASKKTGVEDAENAATRMSTTGTTIGPTCAPTTRQHNHDSVMTIDPENLRYSTAVTANSRLSTTAAGRGGAAAGKSSSRDTAVLYFDSCTSAGVPRREGQEQDVGDFTNRRQYSRCVAQSLSPTKHLSSPPLLEDQAFSSYATVLPTRTPSPPCVSSKASRMSAHQRINRTSLERAGGATGTAAASYAGAPTSSSRTGAKMKLLSSGAQTVPVSSCSRGGVSGGSGTMSTTSAGASTLSHITGATTSTKLQLFGIGTKITKGQKPQPLHMNKIQPLNLNLQVGTMNLMAAAPPNALFGGPRGGHASTTSNEIDARGAEQVIGQQGAATVLQGPQTQPQDESQTRPGSESIKTPCGGPLLPNFLQQNTWILTKKKLCVKPLGTTTGAHAPGVVHPNQTESAGASCTSHANQLLLTRNNKIARFNTTAKKFFPSDNIPKTPIPPEKGKMNKMNSPAAADVAVLDDLQPHEEAQPDAGSYNLLSEMERRTQRLVVDQQTQTPPVVISSRLEKEEEENDDDGSLFTEKRGRETVQFVQSASSPEGGAGRVNERDVESGEQTCSAAAEDEKRAEAEAGSLAHADVEVAQTSAPFAPATPGMGKPEAAEVRDSSSATKDDTATRAAIPKYESNEQNGENSCGDGPVVEDKGTLLAAAGEHNLNPAAEVEVRVQVEEAADVTKTKIKHSTGPKLVLEKIKEAVGDKAAKEVVQVENELCQAAVATAGSIAIAQPQSAAEVSTSGTTSQHTGGGVVVKTLLDEKRVEEVQDLHRPTGQLEALHLQPGEKTSSSSTAGAPAAAATVTSIKPKTNQVEVIRRLFKYPDFNLLDAKFETSVLQQPNTSLKVEVITDTRISTRPVSTYGTTSTVRPPTTSTLAVGQQQCPHLSGTTADPPPPCNKEIISGYNLFAGASALPSAAGGSREKMTSTTAAAVTSKGRASCAASPTSGTSSARTPSVNKNAKLSSLKNKAREQLASKKPIRLTKDSGKKFSEIGELFSTLKQVQMVVPRVVDACAADKGVEKGDELQERPGPGDKTDPLFISPAGAGAGAPPRDKDKIIPEAADAAKQSKADHCKNSGSSAELASSTAVPGSCTSTTTAASSTLLTRTVDTTLTTSQHVDVRPGGQDIVTGQDVVVVGGAKSTPVAPTYHNLPQMKTSTLTRTSDNGHFATEEMLTKLNYGKKTSTTGTATTSGCAKTPTIPSRSTYTYSLPHVNHQRYPTPTSMTNSSGGGADRGSCVGSMTNSSAGSGFAVPAGQVSCFQVQFPSTNFYNMTSTRASIVQPGTRTTKNSSTSASILCNSKNLSNTSKNFGLMSLQNFSTSSCNDNYNVVTASPAIVPEERKQFVNAGVREAGDMKNADDNCSNAGCVDASSGSADHVTPPEQLQHDEEQILEEKEEENFSEQDAVVAFFENPRYKKFELMDPRTRNTWIQATLNTVYEHGIDEAQMRDSTSSAGTSLETVPEEGRMSRTSGQQADEEVEQGREGGTGNGVSGTSEELAAPSGVENVNDKRGRTEDTTSEKQDERGKNDHEVNIADIKNATKRYLSETYNRFVGKLSHE